MHVLFVYSLVCVHVKKAAAKTFVVSVRISFLSAYMQFGDHLLGKLQSTLTTIDNLTYTLHYLFYFLTSLMLNNVFMLLQTNFMWKYHCYFLPNLFLFHHHHHLHHCCHCHPPPSLYARTLISLQKMDFPSSIFNIYCVESLLLRLSLHYWINLCIVSSIYFLLLMMHFHVFSTGLRNDIINLSCRTSLG